MAKYGSCCPAGDILCSSHVLACHLTQKLTHRAQVYKDKKIIHFNDLTSEFGGFSSNEDAIRSVIL